MDDSARIADSFRRRIGSLLAFRGALAFSTVWAAAWGAVILVLRMALNVPRTGLWYSFAGIVPVALAGAILEYRRAPTAFQARAVLDSRNACGGLLMCSDAAGFPEWRGFLPQVRVPGLAWAAGRFSVFFLGSIVFAAVAVAVPDRYVKGVGRSRLDVADVVEDLKARIEVMEEANVIEKEQAELLKGDLDKVQEEASGLDPMKTWEALDHVSDAMTEDSRKFAEDAAKAAAELTAAGTAAETLARMAETDAVGDDALRKSVEELGAVMEKSGIDDRLLDSDYAAGLGLDPATMQSLMEGCRAGTLTPEQLRMLSTALSSLKGGMITGVIDLSKVKLVEAELLEACEGAGTNCNEAVLAACLGGVEGAGLPGQGGISRGRADAAMTWKTPTSDAGFAFKEQQLPAGSLAGFKESKLMGVSFAAPVVGGPDAVSAGGALTDAGSQDANANVHAVLPRHKNSVQRYFTRK